MICCLLNMNDTLIYQHGFGIATTSSLLQILGILSRRLQEDRKPHNQDIKAPVWSISFRKIETGLRALPGFKCWRATVSSLDEKFSEIFAGLDVVALQWLDTSWDRSQGDSRLISSNLPFLPSWDTMVSVETGQWRGECRDLPVKLFKTLHAFWLECEK